MFGCEARTASNIQYQFCRGLQTTSSPCLGQPVSSFHTADVVGRLTTCLFMTVTLTSHQSAVRAFNFEHAQGLVIWHLSAQHILAIDALQLIVHFKARGGKQNPSRMN
eukprot:180039-Amphidinium_carterae.1